MNRTIQIDILTPAQFRMETRPGTIGVTTIGVTLLLLTSEGSSKTLNVEIVEDVER